MKIANNQAIRVFIDRCKANMMNDDKNRFLGMPITRETEKQMQEAMHQSGFNEFLQPKSQWPSLFLSTEEFLQTPYQKNISFESMSDQHIQLEKVTIPSQQLFNAHSIQYDPNRELNDSMILRALDKPYETTVLSIDGDVWMLDVYGEANTIDPFAKKAHGNVITFGLGIGYFVYMAQLNPNVHSITVIEKDKTIIDVFTKHLFKQFPKDNVKIIEGDALDFFNAATLSQYDYCFVDIYQSSDDGLTMMEQLLERYIPKELTTDFWIESSILEPINALLVLYFEMLVYNKPIFHPDKQYRRILMKMDDYFKACHKTITTVDSLKDLMYNSKIAREILAGLSFISGDTPKVESNG